MVLVLVVAVLLEVASKLEDFSTIGEDEGFDGFDFGVSTETTTELVVFVQKYLIMDNKWYKQFLH